MEKHAIAIPRSRQDVGTDPLLLGFAFVQWSLALLVESTALRSGGGATSSLPKDDRLNASARSNRREPWTTTGRSSRSLLYYTGSAG